MPVFLGRSQWPATPTPKATLPLEDRHRLLGSLRESESKGDMYLQPPGRGLREEASLREKGRAEVS